MASHVVSPETFQTFGDLLKYLRRRKRMTQVELSIRVGYSDAQISRLEQNQRLPDLSAIKALFVPALQLEYEPEFVIRLIELAQSARLEDTPEPGDAPYKGLLFFDQSDTDLFFGREALTSHLVKRVNQIANADQPHFLGVVGASGSGKSSLVRAGLARELHRDGWEIHTFTPTSSPLNILAETYDSFSAKNDHNHLLLVDQFEEVFTLCRDEDERLDFIDQLLSIAQEQPSRTTVVITLRADFYAHCAQYPKLREALAAEQEYIGQMTTEELRRAIEEPAIRGGWEFERGLTDILLKDIGVDGRGEPEPGGLPLLSHALLATWIHRRGRLLTHDGYRTSGGVRGAIAETAESIFSDQLNQTQQNLARNIFLRLTELGEGTEDTRRRVSLNELLHQINESNQLREVLNKLANARLITLNNDSAEVSHEALIREWQRLRAWLDHDRVSLHLHRHLTEAAQAWLARGRDSGELYRGARLAQALEWSAQSERRNDLNALEREFLAASRANAESIVQEQEAQRQRDLIAAQRLAETEQKRAVEQAAAAQRLRKRAFYLAGLVLLLVLVAAVAARSAIAANRNLRMATAHDLISSARAELQVDSGHSIALALESLQIEPQVPAINVLHQALFASHLRGSILAHTGDADYIAINPTGDRLATGGGTPGTVKLWEVKGLVINSAPILIVENVISPGWCKGLTSTNLMFSPDGSYLAVGYCNTFISLLDVRSGEVVRTFTPGWQETTGFAFSPDGSRLAAFGQFGHVTIWDVNNGENFLTFQAHEQVSAGFSMTCLDFSPDGKTLVTGGKDGEIKFWRLANKNGALAALPVMQVNQKNEEAIHALRFSPDGSKLANATLSAIHILDLAPLTSSKTPVELIKIPIENSDVWVNSLHFSPDGSRLAILQLGSQFGFTSVKTTGNRIQIVDLSTGHTLMNIVPKEHLLAGVISPTGAYYFSSHAGGLVHSWDISHSGSPEGLAIPAGNNTSRFQLSQDGKHFIAVTPINLEGGEFQFTLWQINRNQIEKVNDFTINLGERQDQVFVDHELTRILISDSQNFIKIYNTTNGALINKIQLGKAGPYGAIRVINADASRLIMQTDKSPDESLVEIWDLNAARLLYHFNIDDTGFYTTFDESGNGIVTYSSNNNPLLIRWWDPALGQEIREIDAQNGTLYGVVFSPDKKYILSWGEDQTLKVREKTSGRLIGTLTPPAQISSVLISSDQQYIAVSLSTSQTVIYHFKNFDEMVTLPGSGINFLPDGKAILNSIPDDSTVYAFFLDHNDLVQLACQRLEQISLGADGETIKKFKICQEVVSNSAFFVRSYENIFIPAK